MFVSTKDLFRTITVRSKKAPILSLQIRQVAKESLLRVCADLPGEVLAAIKIRSFKNGILTIGCTTLVATELSMRLSELVDDINRTCGRKAVLKIRFKIS